MLASPDLYLGTAGYVSKGSSVTKGTPDMTNSLTFKGRVNDVKHLFLISGDEI